MMLVNRSDEEFLLLKTDMLMEPRISLFWSKLMREEWE